jgi:hypothetical protein
MIARRQRDKLSIPRPADEPNPYVPQQAGARVEISSWEFG